MAEISLTITIPTEHAAKVNAALQGLFPIPKVADPDWIDPEDGSKAPLVNEYTDKAWAKQCIIKQFLAHSVTRWANKLRRDEAPIEPIENIAT